ncbi:hypothetical protein Taro_052647 [Colocasia esculenta]|uniref:Glycosyltransferase n=1 Tax=Colocasia esculenta TaxID=4460 RepID=A0A843XIZ4_COLES|nr:hypothetical protein [Colocasia esculenta]
MALAPPLHVLAFASPLQGHLSPMLKLAEALAIKGLLVTFLTTEHVYHRLGGADAPLCCRDGLRLRSVPDGLPADHPRLAGHLGEVMRSLRDTSREKYRELLVSLGKGEPDGLPPVTCTIVDAFLPFAAEVAAELGIPVMAFRTSGPCSFWAYFFVPKLIEQGEVPFPAPILLFVCVGGFSNIVVWVVFLTLVRRPRAAEGCDMDELVRGVPGTEGFLRRRDLPSFCRAKDVNDPVIQATTLATQWNPRARGLIFNSAEPMDAAVLAHIRTLCPSTYTVGPLHNLVRALDPSHIATAAAGLWREDRTCLAWLDAQPPKSVVFVSFGSLTVLSRAHLLEFWHGLVNTHHRFLWVIRPDLLEETGGAGDVLPELKEGTKEKGYLVEWAPQQEVLAHPAVGAFLTHSGWNSTLESISSGVPMVCWPFFFDQMVNSRYVSEVWRAGVDMKDICDRATVEKMVRAVMEGETAEKLRKNAAALAEMVRSCVGEGGSSRVSLEKLVRDTKLGVFLEKHLTTRSSKAREEKHAEKGAS